MDATTIAMFYTVFMVAFIFSLLSLLEFEANINKKPKHTPLMSLIYGAISTICWMVISIEWPIFATADVMIGVSYLWYALMWIFALLTVVDVFLMFKQNIKPKAKETPTFEYQYRDEE